MNILPNKKALGFLSLPVIALTSALTTQQAHSAIFDWGNIGTTINNVDSGDSFVASNVDGSGVNFTFTFTNSTSNGLNAIISESNQASDFPTNTTGRRNFEGNGGNIYTDNPLYVVGKGDVATDSVVITITMSQAVNISNLIIGDIDRFVSTGLPNGFEDQVTITSSLLGTSVNNNIVGGGANHTITGNNSATATASSTSGGALDSTLAASQINVTTLGAVDTLTIEYFNADADGISNSHWITLGTDARFTNFTVASVPEPSSVSLLGLGSICLLMRRKR